MLLSHDSEITVQLLLHHNCLIGTSIFVDTHNCSFSSRSLQFLLLFAANHYCLQEMLTKKLQQKYVRVKEEMERWGELQSLLLSQFGNASAIIEILPVLNEDQNYGLLKCVGGFKEALIGNQMETLERLFSSMKGTMHGFSEIIFSMDKIVRDTNQLLKGATPHDMQLHVGIKPSFQDCVVGLRTIQAMYKSEYELKSSLVSALTLKCSANDIAVIRQLLVDQPNISSDEVQSIFDIIFAEDIC